MRNTEKMATMNIRLPNSTKVWLMHTAGHYGVGLSDIVRDALEQYKIWWEKNDEKELIAR